MSTDADRLVDLIEYCASIAGEFQSRLSRLRTFVKKHNLSSGNANESILREFLSRHAPARICVGQGFIYNLFREPEEDSVSRQSDILIFDQSDYPLVYSDGPIKVVLPGSVRMVIEVKTRLDKKELTSAVENIYVARKLNRRMRGIIFAFDSIDYKRVVQHLKNHASAHNAPTAILLLNQGVIIHNYEWLRYREGLKFDSEGKVVEELPLNAIYSYAVRRTKTGGKADAERGTFVVAFLLLLFFHAVGAHGLIESIPINALITTMEEFTEKIGDDIQGGVELTQ